MVALDPSAPFAAAIRRLLPHATIVVDHCHLVRLANQMVTDVRQCVARAQLGRGRKRPSLGAPAAAARRREPAVPPRAGPARAAARRRRPNRRDRRRLGRQGVAPP
ncbi:transposase, partial [Lentzea sp.]|uniref:transposase n=1 Tax=Lentzea sp. TaxID=56099 RepID=UPI0039C9F9E9